MHLDWRCLSFISLRTVIEIKHCKQPPVREFLQVHFFCTVSAIFRTQLAVLHYNENALRPQAKTKKGKKKYKVKMSRPRPGHFFVSPLKTKPTFGTWAQLFHNNCKRTNMWATWYCLPTLKGSTTDKCKEKTSCDSITLHSQQILWKTQNKHNYYDRTHILLHHDAQLDYNKLIQNQNSCSCSVIDGSLICTFPLFLIWHASMTS